MTERRRKQNREAQARWRAKHPNAMREYYAENRDFMLKKMKFAYQERKERANERDNPRGRLQTD